MLDIVLKSEEDSRGVALKLKELLVSRGGVVFFEGELGTGKTFLCSEIIKQLSNGIFKASSPTFNILKYYELEPFPVYHCDLYRLKNETELFELGITELENSIVLIEWPQIAQEFIIPDYTVKLQITDSQQRKCSLVKH